jgi:hypothetical protein
MNGENLARVPLSRARAFPFVPGKARKVGKSQHNHTNGGPERHAVLPQSEGESPPVKTATTGGNYERRT